MLLKKPKKSDLRREKASEMGRGEELGHHFWNVVSLPQVFTPAHCLNILHAENKLLQVNFELATAQYCQVMNRPGLQSYAATLIRREEKYFVDMYGRIISIKSPSFCTTNLSTSIKNLMVLLPQSHDCSCYISKQIVAPPPL